VVPTNVVSLPLKHVKNTIYATAIDQDKYLNNTRMYLAISPKPVKNRSFARFRNWSRRARRPTSNS
jgi:hypothetical protein